jgi:hypothetical protein
MSYETRYSAAMRQRSDAASSTPEAAAARSKLQDALDRAQADVDARFPVLTDSVYEEAFDYQGERIAYWRKELGA